MLVHGFAPAPNLHLGYTLPSIRSCLRGVVRLNSCPAANQKAPNCDDRHWHCARAGIFLAHDLKRQSALSGGKP
jgi:hypothetical protein